MISHDVSKFLKEAHKSFHNRSVLNTVAVALLAGKALIPAIPASAQTGVETQAASPAVAAPPTVQPEVAREYAAILKRVQQGDTTVNFRKFRVDGALIAADRSSWHEAADRAMFKRLMDAGNTEEALDSANRSLERNYASVYGHINAMLACTKLNRSGEAALHRTIAAALLDSIQRSGDGKSPETAYFVTTIPEEYALLAYRLRLTRKLQSLVRQDGHAYDRLDAVDPKTNETQTIWFNTDVDMHLYKPPAPRTPETKSKLQKALQLYIAGQFLSALPLVEDLLTSNPEDAGLQMVLADCLSFKADTNVTPDEAAALLNRAREAALRARQLGDNSLVLNKLLMRLDKPQAELVSSPLIPNQ